MKNLIDGLLYVIVFGPGFGESTLVRVPPDYWIVLDGCGASRSVPAAELIEQGARWSGIVFTHPHADHAVGLGAVLDLDGSGPVGCADLRLEDVVQRAGSKARYIPGVAEGVLARIQSRWEEEPETRWDLIRGNRKSIGDADLEVLHPAPDDVARFPYSDADANKISSAMRMNWKNVTVLLGADVLSENWRSISADYNGLSDHVLLKAPHHMSAGAHHGSYAQGGRERLWVATPFNRQSPGIPRFGDGEGLSLFLSEVDRIHLTGIPVAADKQADFGPTATRGEVDAHMRAADRVLSPTTTMTMIQLLPRDRKPNETNWVMVGIDEQGTFKDLQRGPGSVVVTA